MSLWSRIANVFRTERLNRELDDELASHLEEAVAHGRDEDEARRALGSALHHREASRDVRVVAWLDSLRADVIFGWRQFRKYKITSAAAVLSLALAIGSCMAAFLLVDALLLRPLPVAEPQRLYSLWRSSMSREHTWESWDTWSYPSFRQMREAVKDQADLIAVSYAQRLDFTFGSDAEMEKEYVQFVSGWMFDDFGLNPAAGRLLRPADDDTPNAHPYAVLSYDYWTRRFARDPNVVGRTFRMGTTLYQVVGVAPQRFTGTEPGIVTGIFLPTMMYPSVNRADEAWMRTMVRMNPGGSTELVRSKSAVVSRALEEERLSKITALTREELERALDERISIRPAGAGVSIMQTNYRLPLVVLGVLVLLVLLIACANVANLMTAQAASRQREMALRVSIGAGRWRLVRLVLVESAITAMLAGTLGCLFAWGAAPYVVGRINPPDNPARLVLSPDWRVFAFGILLTLTVTLLFGLAPALRASHIQPAAALKGGHDPHARRRLMHTLTAGQVAFCFVVLFVASLLVATFERLTAQSPGFNADRVLLLETVADRPQPVAYFDQVAEHLRTIPGVEAVGISNRPLLGGFNWNNFIFIHGAPTKNIANMLAVSPGWFETMRAPLVVGRDFRPDETFPGSAIVNERVVREYFHGQDAVGQHFQMNIQNRPLDFVIVGVMKDLRYKNLREPIPPQVFVPFHWIDEKGALRPKPTGVIAVRTASQQPLSMASTLRREVTAVRPEIRVSNIRTQQEVIDGLTVRERLLATIAMFFGAVALVLAGVGLYGVLHYSVVQRRREIGIRMAVGAQAADIARAVTVNVFAMILTGMVCGLALAQVAVRFLDTLLFQVRATDPSMLITPWLVILAAGFLAALAPVVRATRVDPSLCLRAE